MHSKDRAGVEEAPIAWSSPWVSLPSCLLKDLLQEMMILLIQSSYSDTNLFAEMFS